MFVTTAQKRKGHKCCTWQHVINVCTRNGRQINTIKGQNKNALS